MWKFSHNNLANENNNKILKSARSPWKARRVIDGGDVPRLPACQGKAHMYMSDRRAVCFTSWAVKATTIGIGPVCAKRTQRKSQGTSAANNQIIKAIALRNYAEELTRRRYIAIARKWSDNSKWGLNGTICGRPHRGKKTALFDACLWNSPR